VTDKVRRVTAGSLRQIVPSGKGPVPEIPQLLLSESGAFITACRALEKAGFSGVNWNLGCPSRGVVRKKKGAGLLPDTDHIINILNEVLPQTGLKISLKMRLGLTSRDDLFRLIPHLKQLPLQNLILHPRLGNQMYQGRVDLESFQKALFLYGRKICYNGDIRTLEDYISLTKRFPEVDEWMIGRGLLSDPFLLERIREYQTSPSLTGIGKKTPHPFQNRAYLDFLDDLVDRLKGEFFKETSLWNYLKGILSYTFLLTDTPGDMKNDLKRVSDTGDWQRLRDKIKDFSCQ